MPLVKPSLLFNDFFGSAGEVTAYHRDGKCYIRKRSRGRYGGTAAQLAALDVHRRALAAWRTQSAATQKIWHQYGREAEPHKPPFDHKAHISGHNLFVSAYHGFAALGDEHIPSPMPFDSFPPFAVSVSGAAREGGVLRLYFRVTLGGVPDGSRYWVLAKIQLAEPGAGMHSGLMKNFLADAPCADEEVSVRIPDYINLFGMDQNSYQVHARLILLDTVTGYRSQYQQVSTIVTVA